MEGLGLGEIVESWESGDMTVDEFMTAVEEYVNILHPPPFPTCPEGGIRGAG
ncbi:hypothetical protein [Nonomuraea fuscirosea]|uniref:hypothetical protein n=1 Tax=Nonomuraea fuscirosea TaxID=1291556 RepID=UPI0033EAF766